MFFSRSFHIKNLFIIKFYLTAVKKNETEIIKQQILI